MGILKKTDFCLTMRTALIIEWNGQGKATLTGATNPFILLDVDLLKVLNIEKPGTYHLGEAKIRIDDDSAEPWRGTVEFQGQTHTLFAHCTSAFMGSDTYTLSLAPTLVPLGS